MATALAVVQQTLSMINHRPYVLVCTLLHCLCTYILTATICALTYLPIITGCISHNGTSMYLTTMCIYTIYTPVVQLLETGGHVRSYLPFNDLDYTIVGVIWLPRPRGKRHLTSYD